MLTYSIIETDQLIDQDFDLEAWLADLLVDYWLAQRGDDA